MVIFRKLPLWGMIAVVTAFLSVGGFAAHGFTDKGYRLGSELAWRFTFFVYFVAVIAGPVTRFMRVERLQRLGRDGGQLLWGFSASFGVFLASLLIPNTMTPATPGHEGLTAGMAMFVLFGAGLTGVIAYAASPQPNLGERSRRTILGVGLAYFWLAYTLTALSHLSGPHRADAFYGFTLVLMLVVLLVRFADRFVAKMRVRDSLPQV